MDVADNIRQVREVDGGGGPPVGPLCPRRSG